MLVALGMNLVRLKSELIAPTAEVEAVIADTSSLVDEMSRELRTMSYLLHPPLLDEAGLGSAVRWYTDGFAKRSALEVTLELSADLGRLPQELEITIFRLIQESLTNIHRHSGSKTASICVTRNSIDVCVEIRDQGKGLTTAKRSKEYSRPGVGILGMKERVRRFGGTLEFLSNHPGTTVRAKLPIHPDAQLQAAV
jgi:signal transduction histidine kinase